MAWDLLIHMKDPTRYEIDELHIATYNTQNEARWWAVAFADRGSVSYKQGTPEEDLIPMSHVIRFIMRES